MINLPPATQKNSSLLQAERLKAFRSVFHRQGEASTVTFWLYKCCSFEMCSFDSQKRNQRKLKARLFFNGAMFCSKKARKVHWWIFVCLAATQPVPRVGDTPPIVTAGNPGVPEEDCPQSVVRTLRWEVELANSGGFARWGALSSCWEVWY